MGGVPGRDAAAPSRRSWRRRSAATDRSPGSRVSWTVRRRSAARRSRASPAPAICCHSAASRVAVRLPPLRGRGRVGEGRPTRSGDRRPHRARSPAPCAVDWRQALRRETIDRGGARSPARGDRGGRARTGRDAGDDEQPRERQRAARAPPRPAPPAAAAAKRRPRARAREDDDRPCGADDEEGGEHGHLRGELGRLRRGEERREQPDRDGVHPSADPPQGIVFGSVIMKKRKTRISGEKTRTCQKSKPRPARGASARSSRGRSRRARRCSRRT